MTNKVKYLIIQLQGKQTIQQTKGRLIIMTKTNLTINEMWDTLLDLGVSEQTLQVVTDINGYNEQSMKDILYSVSGYNDFDQL